MRAAADAAVRALGWERPYFVDADHITMATVDRFLAPCDFFTLDVADAIGRPPAPGAVEAFLARHPELVGGIAIAGIAEPIRHDARGGPRRPRSHYLHAVAEAGRIYRYVEAQKGAGTFVTEVSMDETAAPQTPAELLLILAALADEAARADDRAQVHRPVQQGRGLRGRRRRSSRGSSATTSPSSLTPCGLRTGQRPQAQRPLRQRQVLHLPGHPPHAGRPAPACT